MYIQGLLLIDKESLNPIDCHFGETNCTGYDPNILVRPENNVLLILIDNHFVHNGCLTNFVMGLISIHIIDRCLFRNKNQVRLIFV